MQHVVPKTHNVRFGSPLEGVDEAGQEAGVHGRLTRETPCHGLGDVLAELRLVLVELGVDLALRLHRAVHLCCNGVHAVVHQLRPVPRASLELLALLGCHDRLGNETVGLLVELLKGELELVVVHALSVGASSAQPLQLSDIHDLYAPELFQVVLGRREDRTRFVQHHLLENVARVLRGLELTQRRPLPLVLEVNVRRELFLHGIALVPVEGLKKVRLKPTELQHVRFNLLGLPGGFFLLVPLDGLRGGVHLHEATLNRAESCDGFECDRRALNDDVSVGDLFVGERFSVEHKCARHDLIVVLHLLELELLRCDGLVLHEYNNELVKR
eukprot:PhM_4_TR14634/c0_g2_i1/m.80810